MSLSSWRAWIEIQTGWIQWHGAGRSPHGERGLKYRLDFLVELRGSRSPHGERGLKSTQHITGTYAIRRSPHGERGLKYPRPERMVHARRSLSSWRAWIEIYNWPCQQKESTRRSPHGERGLKSYGTPGLRAGDVVALLMESVD